MHVILLLFKLATAAHLTVFAWHALVGGLIGFVVGLGIGFIKRWRIASAVLGALIVFCFMLAAEKSAPDAGDWFWPRIIASILAAITAPITNHFIRKPGGS